MKKYWKLVIKKVHNIKEISYNEVLCMDTPVEFLAKNKTVFYFTNKKQMLSFLNDYKKQLS
jgi:hypothetical protein